MPEVHPPLGRRERAKADKLRRIITAARELFDQADMATVTTQQVADRADVAVGTLFRYAATKAELLILVQNQKFATAIDDGIAAATAATGSGAIAGVMALIEPVVTCVRERRENGRTYLHELVFGDPDEPHRHQGLVLSAQLEQAVAHVLRREDHLEAEPASTLARVVSAILHLTVTATVHLYRSDTEVLAEIREQLRVTVTHHNPRSTP